jgi:VanZ family protein
MSLLVKHFLRYQFPAIAWAAIIFYASSIPASKLPKFALMISDKVIHGTIFFVLGLLVYRALEPRIKSTAFSWKRFLVAILAVIAYGFLDEFHQGFVPGRSVDIKDATADAVGGLISGVMLYIFSLRKRVES